MARVNLARSVFNPPLHRSFMEAVVGAPCRVTSRATDGSADSTVAQKLQRYVLFRFVSVTGTSFLD
jgi:hypothetical protein